MRQRLRRVADHLLLRIPLILLFMPLIYVVTLSTYASINYGSYYGSLIQIAFDFYSLLGGCILSSVALVAVYGRLIQNHTNLIAKFLATHDLMVLFNSDLLRDLQKKGQIEKVEKLTGGYSGAQVYLFTRKDSVPDILKVASVEEIDNEYKKFTKYVEGKLLNCPRGCPPYSSWGNDYAGLEYSLNWTQPGCDHLTFLEIYRECLSANTQPPVEVATIQGLISRLFEGLQASESWKWGSDVLLKENRGMVNIYEEHYPFATKISGKIYPRVKTYIKWAQKNLGLEMLVWDESALKTLLNLGEWTNRKSNPQYEFLIARAIIHGDLNSRNILLDVKRDNHNTIHTVGLVDFSHTGNGLTIKRTKEAIQAGIKIAEDKGHLVNDFCRLEADIKFYLTDLNDEQDLRRAWILECLLLEKGLQLPNWEELQQNNAFRNILQAKKLLNKTEWEALADPGYWTEDNAKKFILAWQSVKAIRSSFHSIVPDKLRSSMEPFYLALLQASLSMIYYEDKRFHNGNLQKFYLVLASDLLCEQLSQRRF